jgi:hypothetical protein
MKEGMSKAPVGLPTLLEVQGAAVDYYGHVLFDNEGAGPPAWWLEFEKSARKNGIPDTWSALPSEDRKAFAKILVRGEFTEAMMLIEKVILEDESSSRIDKNLTGKVLELLSAKQDAAIQKVADSDELPQKFFKEMTCHGCPICSRIKMSR